MIKPDFSTYIASLNAIVPSEIERLLKLNFNIEVKQIEGIEGTHTHNGTEYKMIETQADTIGLNLVKDLVHRVCDFVAEYTPQFSSVVLVWREAPFIYAIPSDINEVVPVFYIRCSLAVEEIKEAAS